ncbi:hypothetical protein CBL_14056 [Carabus blaptoides fortunei]
MVFRGTDKTEESSGMMSKSHATKFLNKPRSGNSQYTSTNSSAGLEYAKFTDQDVQDEFRRLYTQLELLKEKNMRFGNRHLAAKISAMQDAAARLDTHGDPFTNKTHPTIHESDSTYTKFNSIKQTMTDKAVCATIISTLKPQSKQIETTVQPDNKVNSDVSPTEPVGNTKSKNKGESDDLTCLACGTSVIVAVHEPEQESSEQDETKHKQVPTSEGNSNVTGQNECDHDQELDSTSINDQHATNNEASNKCCPSPTGSVGKATAKENGNDNGIDDPVTGSGRLIKSGHARTHAIVINLDDKSRFTEEVTV